MAQRDDVNSLHKLLDFLLNKDGLHSEQNLEVPALGRSFALPTQATELLQACIAVTTLYGFQKAFWGEMI